MMVPKLSSSSAQTSSAGICSWAVLYRTFNLLYCICGFGDSQGIGLPQFFRVTTAQPLTHDLTPIHEITVNLAPGATVFGDKGYRAATDAQTILNECGVRLVAVRRKNTQPNRWADDFDLRLYRKRIETIYSQM